MPAFEGPMLGFDVVGYSRRSNLDQADVQRRIQDELGRAIDRLKDDILHKIWINAGDGGYLVMQGHVGVGPKLLELFVENFRRDNESRRPDSVVEMRHALHWGLVNVEEERLDLTKSGTALNDLARILELMPHDEPGMVVISDEYRARLVDGREALSDNFTRLPPIAGKHEKKHLVWNFSTGRVGVKKNR